MDNLTFEDADSVMLLALCIYGEARGESQRGKCAIANVVCNRLENDFEDSIKEIILKPKQFSCFNTNNVNRQKMLDILNEKKHDKVFDLCYDIADDILNNYFDDNRKDNTNGATHYQVIGTNSSWSKKMECTCVIGNHEFFKEKRR